MKATSRGYLFALIAFGTWGILPVYWKQIHSLPLLEILGHRMIWSSLTMIIALAIFRDHSWLNKLRRSPVIILIVLVCALLTAANWSTYLWAVKTGFVAKISLGYFINPLLSVVLGAVFLGERLRRGQIVAVLIAVAGVIYLTVSAGELPWIALMLALTFGFYGLIRKKVDLSGMQFYCLEMSLLLVPALLILFFIGQLSTPAWTGSGWPSVGLLLLGTGVVSAIPLVSFGAASRLIPLSSLGLMQYLAPSTQFLLGVFLYNEPFTAVELIGYAFIWTALLLYTLEGLRHSRKALPIEATSPLATPR